MNLNEQTSLNADNTILIDGTRYNVESLTCEDLRVHHRTGRNVHISGTGRNRVSKYRAGIMTNIGDIEISVWKDLMRKVIVRLSETKLQEQLQYGLKDHCAWLRNPSAVEQDALELHASRIFDNPSWDAYIDFNRQYRPEVLERAALIWVQRKCCGKIIEMTIQQFEWRKSLNGGEVFCHDCGCHTPLVLIGPQKEGDDQNG